MIYKDKMGMKTMLKALAVLGLTCISAYIMYIDGYIGEQLGDSASLMAIAECALLFVWLWGTMEIASRRKDETGKTIRWEMIVVILVICSYLWMHRIMLPIIVTGLYVLMLVTLGELVMLPIKKRIADSELGLMLNISVDFILGASIWIIIICLLSVVRLAHITQLRMITICLGAPVMASYLLCIYIGMIPRWPVRAESKEKKNHISCLLIAVAMTMLLMQAGRLNITTDYDSLHYELRSESILDPEGSIYDDLGLVNDVYVYPKGAEILALPLYSKNTYGYVMSLSWWIGVGVVYIIYELVRKLTDKTRGIAAAVMTVTTPGIINMSASAKTDIITLFIQLVVIYAMVRYFKLTEDGYQTEGRRVYMYMAVGAALFSFMLKPTAIVFTGTVIIATIVYLFASRKKASSKAKKVTHIQNCLVVLIPFLALIPVTLRTLILTGMPITSTYTVIWQMLGLKLRYPLYPGANGTSQTMLSAHTWIKRVVEIFAAPVSEDMMHVYIAWGGLLIIIAILMTIISVSVAISKRKNIETQMQYIIYNMIALSVVSIATLAMLGQVDGNYYMLLYAVSIVVICMLSNKLIWTAPAVIYAGLLCFYTNWAGAYGLTPIKFNHVGYYDHMTDRIDDAYERGVGLIYDYLDESKGAHVLAVANQPECFMTECYMQSYTDIEGSCGNVTIVKTLDDFKQFLDHADMNYLYVENEYLTRHDRASDIIDYMVEDTSLTQVIEDKGGALYSYTHMPTLD